MSDLGEEWKCSLHNLRQSQVVRVAIAICMFIKSRSLQQNSKRYSSGSTESKTYVSACIMLQEANKKIELSQWFMYKWKDRTSLCSKCHKRRTFSDFVVKSWCWSKYRYYYGKNTNLERLLELQTKLVFNSHEELSFLGWLYVLYFFSFHWNKCQETRK